MAETPFRIAAERAPDLTEDEIRRRLGQVYRTILTYQPESDAADRGEFGDQARSAAGGVPALEPEAQHEV